MQEAYNISKDVAPVEKSAKDLRIHAMHPLAAEFDRVVPPDDREVISHVRMPKNFVYARFEKERLAETERGCKADCSIRHAGRIDRDARTIFPGVREVCFIQLGRGNGTEPIRADRLDFGGAFDPIRGGSV